MKNKRRIKLYCLFVIIGMLSSFSLHADDAAGGKLKVLVLKGTPYQRGLIHGKTLKNEIHTIINLWKKKMTGKEAFKDKDPDKLMAGFLKKTRFYEAAKKWTPEILDEIKGISDGSGLPLDLIKLFQVSDEFDTFDRYLLFDRCTSVGVSASGSQPTMIAQNMDIPPFMHQYPILLHVIDEASGMESYVYSCPGLLALCGMNNKAIGITCNALTQLKFSADGLPATFIVRGVLNQKKYADAVDFLHRITHAIGQNYLVGGPQKAESYECSVKQVIQYKPKGKDRIVYHTNHPIKNKNYFPQFLEALEKRKITLEDYDARCSRLKSLEKQFKAGDQAVPLPLMKKILSDRTNYINNDYTYGTLIMVLSPQPELHLAPGRPDEQKFRVFRFKHQELVR